MLSKLRVKIYLSTLQKQNKTTTKQEKIQKQNKKKTKQKQKQNKTKTKHLLVEQWIIKIPNNLLTSFFLFLFFGKVEQILYIKGNRHNPRFSFGFFV